MRLAKGALARTTNGLNLRAGAGTQHSVVAVLKKDALLWAVEDPAAGWVRVEMNGWTQDGKTICFEDDELSGVKATKNASATAGEWQAVTLAGYVSTGYLSVVDGPA